jgi:hypothetical protein
VSVLGASFSVGYCVPISSVWSSHEKLDMGPWFTMVVGLLQHGGIPFLNGTLVLYSTSALWSTLIHGTLVYGCTSSVEDNTFIRGMECKVAREVVRGGGGCRGPIVIIVEAIQCKVD